MTSSKPFSKKLNGSLLIEYYKTSETHPDRVDTVWLSNRVPIKQVPYDNERIAYNSVQKNYDYNRLMDMEIKKLALRHLVV